jgi:hypothetical protein
MGLLDCREVPQSVMNEQEPERELFCHWRKIRSLKDEAAELAVQAKATGQSFQPALNHSL